MTVPDEPGNCIGNRNAAGHDAKMIAGHHVIERRTTIFTSGSTPVCCEANSACLALSPL
jgi:hypothetical protein